MRAGEDCTAIKGRNRKEIERAEHEVDESTPEEELRDIGRRVICNIDSTAGNRPCPRTGSSERDECQ